MGEFLGDWKRTALCAEFTTDDIDREVTLMGWADTRRDLGGLVFVDLRDRSGIMQVVFDESMFEGDFDQVSSIRSEFVLAVKGKIVKRSEDTVNPKLPTGLIEVKVRELKILSKAETPPFEIEDGSKVREELRLKYRYLDLRRPEMQKNLILRNKIANSARAYLTENGFLDIETPMLQKSTPEGARDYLVPSRIHPGCFYALPQSPQLFKQILMISGYDRYFQITKCFRDEDLRADRQPEFTQIDTEMSFVDADDVMAVHEGLLQRVFKDVLDINIELPLKRLSYQEAMDRFGSDKPDTRFGLELKDVSDIVAGSEFKVFSSVVKNGGSVRAINAKGCANILARREIDALVEFVKIYGAKGMAWISIREDGLNSPITKFMTQEEIDGIMERLDGKVGDILFFVGDKNSVVYDSLGALRLKLAEKLNLIEDNTWDLLWVTEFPLFEYSEEEKRYVAKHHPFTSPMDEDIDKVTSDPEHARAKAYDIVLNGNEIGGGSIRIHSTELQEKMFEALGFSKEDAWERFGFLLEALKYGTPPHGGLAYGLDRLAMLMAGVESIRDVIAFPKVQNASDLMSKAPDTVDRKQLRELHIKVDED
ncbi:aspartate--tRNA ligase [Christensenella tenuis]|uniref:Aspartate--tRNA ligase n=1 Tax=Christensenella tenuis TaxID=2763033 RepID=A0ABR7EBR5_9FIRM|nr:aspartate--tRNA ligase [Christensenella tenuis]MBC5647108.1 aspartate--tRNA ligase [Christensenella tenuis]